jgi:hypothetical protein
VSDELEDKWFRINHLYSIVDKGGNRRTMTPNVVQTKILQSKSLRKMVLKARQFGVSTGCLISDLDDTIHTENMTACIVAHEQDSIKKLFRIVHRAYRYMDPRIKPVIDRGGGSKYEMFFPELNSRIYCDLESRGDTIQRLHISEMAFIKEEDKLKATLQAVPLKTGKVTIESTPNGIANMFYDMWNDSNQPYEKFFFPWFVFPEYAIHEGVEVERTPDEKEFVRDALKRYGVTITDEQIRFRRYKQTELGRLFIQEYPEDDQTCFLSSGQAAMDLFLVKQLMSKATPPIYSDRKLKLYVPHRNSHRYAVGVDTSEGIGGDNSVAVMFDVNTREQVAVLCAGKSRPSDFAHEVYRLCEKYMSPAMGWPLLGVERNNHGHAVLLELDEHIGYHNLYVHRDERKGWLTDRVTRPLMIDTFIDGVEKQSVKLNDLETFQECLTLIDDEGKVQAAEGKKDDRVIASAIGLQMVLNASVGTLYDNIREKILV